MGERGGEASTARGIALAVARSRLLLLFLLLPHRCCRCASSFSWPDYCQLPGCDCRLRWSEVTRTTLKSLECRGADAPSADALASLGAPLADEVESFAHVGDAAATAEQDFAWATATTPSVGDGDWSRLRSLPQLRSVRLERTQASLGTLPPLGRLSLLSVSEISVPALEAQALSRVSTGLLSVTLRACALSRIDADAFVGLGSLLKLDLSSNRIAGLTARHLAGLGRLRILDLSSNFIAELPPADAFAALPLLEELRLTNNALQHIDAGAFAALLPSIRLLYVDWNPLATLSASDALLQPPAGTQQQQQQHHLLTLDASGATIERLDAGAFSGLNVTRVVANECRRLRYVGARAFHDLPVTEVLELSGCRRLTYVHEDAFSQLPALKVLALRENGLLAPPVADEAALGRLSPSLLLLSVDRNPFFCDCTLNWLVEYAARRRAAAPSGGEPRSAAALVTLIDVESASCADERGAEWPLRSLARYKRADACAPRIVHPSSSAPTTEATTMPTPPEGEALEAYEGGLAALECYAVGVPAPRFRWLRNGQPIPAAAESGGGGEQYHVDDGGRRLVVFPVRTEHGGSYACVAENARGNASARYELVVVSNDAALVLLAAGSEAIEFALANATRGRTYYVTLADADDGRVTAAAAAASGGASAERTLVLPPARATHGVSGLRPNAAYRLCLVAPPPSSHKMTCLRVRTGDDAAAAGGGAHWAAVPLSGGSRRSAAPGRTAAAAAAAATAAWTSVWLLHAGRHRG